MTCRDMQEDNAFAFEYLAVCVWLPLVSMQSEQPPGMYANPLRAPLRSNGDTAQTGFHEFTQVLDFGGGSEGDIDGNGYMLEGYKMECNESGHFEIIQRLYQKHSWGRGEQSALVHFRVSAKPA